MQFQILQNADISYLNDILLDEDGYLKVLDSSVLEDIDYNHLRIFCNKNGIYQLITTELIEWIKERIGGRRAIEIGSGNGSFARALGITATDSHMQERSEIAFYYKTSGQAPVKYGKNVKKFDAKKAIKKLKPRVVVACWVTQIYKPDSDQGNVYGIDEGKLIKQVETYIHI